MQPELLADYACECGENPLWHPLEKRLYWTDIPTGRLFWFDPATGQHQQCYHGRPVGGFTVQADGALLLFMSGCGIAVFREGRIERQIIEQIPEEAAANARFNDLIADPEGRVFCGTMATKTRPGRLYRLDRDGSLHQLFDGVGVSNGIGFTPDRRQMYYTDSRPREISLFDYDQATGALSNRRVWLKVPEGQGVPDGMTVDARGHVWSARWDGWALYHYDPTGREIERLQFPVKKVSSVVFGGEDCSDMYVTTAGGHKRDENGPTAGALYRLRGVARGVPEFFSRIGI